MDIRVLRNAYGRQLGSFFTRSTFAGMEDVPQRNMLATSFHPELNDDPRIHRWFIEHLIEKPE